MTGLRRTSSAPLIPALALLGALSGCVAAPGTGLVGPSEPGDPLRVVWVHARSQGGGATVTGFVRREIGRSGPVAGFIRIAAPRADGSGEAVTCLESRDLRPAGPRGATFAVRFRGAFLADRIAARYARRCRSDPIGG